jgi:diguanylate cyclase (GGDEF)-like protein
MRRFGVLTLAVMLCAGILSGCGKNEGQVFDVNLVRNFRDIPGVTIDETDTLDAFVKENRSFSFGVFLSAGAYIQKDGQYEGFLVDLCGQLYETLGICFNLRVYDSWRDAIYALDNGNVDFMCGLTPTASSRELYCLSLPVADPPLLLLTCTGDYGIQTENDVAGKALGYYQGTATAETICEKYPYLDFTAIPVETTEEAALLLASGAIDGFVVTGFFVQDFEAYDFIAAREFFMLASMPVAIAAENLELKEIISVIDKYIEAGGIDYLYNLYREDEIKYARYRLRRSFTEEEKAYIDYYVSHGVSVPVAMYSDYYPVCFFDEQLNEFQGIAPDLLQQITVLTDIPFTAANKGGAAPPEVLRQLQSYEVPMISFLLQTDARSPLFDWSEYPYAQSYYALLSKQDYPPISFYQIYNSVVGVVRDTAYEYLIHELFQDSERLRLVLFDDQDTALEALENGSVDLLMMSEYALLMQTHYREKSGYKVNYRISGLPHDVFFGFHKGEDVLRRIIDKAMRYVDTNASVTYWTTRVYDYSQVIDRQNTQVLALSVLVLFICLAFVTVLLLDNKRIADSLREQAFTDSLTGIFNRRHFMELAIPQIERTARLKNDSFIFIMDLDHFKTVNDTYGHMAGDKVLQTATMLIKDAVRPYDLFGRYGGEEFILLISDTGKEAAVNLANRLRLLIADKPVGYGEHMISITASFGVSRVVSTMGFESAIRAADDAVYEAKNTGRNRVEYKETVLPEASI